MYGVVLGALVAYGPLQNLHLEAPRRPAMACPDQRGTSSRSGWAWDLNPAPASGRPIVAGMTGPLLSSDGHLTPHTKRVFSLAGWRISPRHSSLIEGRPRRGRSAKLAHFLLTNSRLQRSPVSAFTSSVRPGGPWEPVRQGGEDESIGRPPVDNLHLAFEDADLVAQDQQLCLRLRSRLV